MVRSLRLFFISLFVPSILAGAARSAGDLRWAEPRPRAATDSPRSRMPSIREGSQEGELRSKSLSPGCHRSSVSRVIPIDELALAYRLCKQSKLLAAKSQDLRSMLNSPLTKYSFISAGSDAPVLQEHTEKRMKLVFDVLISELYLEALREYASELITVCSLIKPTKKSRSWCVGSGMSVRQIIDLDVELIGMINEWFIISGIEVKEDGDFHFGNKRVDDGDLACFYKLISSYRRMEPGHDESDWHRILWEWMSECISLRGVG